LIDSPDSIWEKTYSSVDSSAGSKEEAMNALDPISLN